MSTVRTAFSGSTRVVKLRQFAVRLRIAITRRGLPICTVVRSAGLTQRAVEYYLQGKREPSASVLADLSTALNCDPQWLWGQGSKLSIPPALAPYTHHLKDCSFLQPPPGCARAVCDCGLSELLHLPVIQL